MFFRSKRHGAFRLAPAHLTMAAILAGMAMLSGCAALPTNGPTVGQLQKTIRDGGAGISAQLVPVDATTVQALAVANGDTGRFSPLQQDDAPFVPETIRPNDVLNVTIYEVGISLFGSQSNSSAQTGIPAAGAQQIGGVRVDDKGVIDLPYVGTLAVVGLTPREIGKLIEQRLRGLSQSPQAVVTVADSSQNAVSLSGAVGRSGRYRLSVARERLRDLIAMAGGAGADPEDIVVRFYRGDTNAEMRLSDIRIGSADDIFLSPGDRLELLRRPRTFTVFGASDRVSQVPFSADKVSLLEAIARAGGPSEPRANPRGVFLFRWEDQVQGSARPVIYRVDMMQAGSYFVASQFMLRDKDILYFANSASNPPTKFISILNQLFSPIVTARALTN